MESLDADNANHAAPEALTPADFVPIMDRIDGAAPRGPVRDVGPVRRTLGEVYRPTGRDFLRVVGAVMLVAVAAGKHDAFAVRSGLPVAAVWPLLSCSALAAAYTTARILTGRCVGFVPTMIICCTGGITLATLAYEGGEIVARWLT